MTSIFNILKFAIHHHAVFLYEKKITVLFFTCPIPQHVVRVDVKAFTHLTIPYRAQCTITVSSSAVVVSGESGNDLSTFTKLSTQQFSQYNNCTNIINSSKRISLFCYACLLCASCFFL